MERRLKDYVVLMLKGMGMGAADVVPGVSGGTIAFIAGIYDELIDSIKNINLTSLKLLFTGRFAAFWKAVNANFLLSILCGIGVSVFSLAKLITYLLDNQPILVWSFFFGLVLASACFVSKDIKEWNWKTVSGLLAGVAVAFYITVATPAETSTQLWFIFLCGAVAICAMILPGISGSFILLLMGKYTYIMGAVKELNVLVLGVFAAGALVGITSFSHILSYALKRFRNLTLAVLTGFMLGSLNKVWPWKVVERFYTDSHGVQKALVEHNVWPGEQLLPAILLAVVGFGLVYGLEKVSAKAER